MTMTRRSLLLALAGAGAAGPLRAQQPITVTDIAGRTVVLPQPARRLLLAQGRQLAGLGLVHPDPVSLVCGLGGDFQRQDAATYAQYLSAYPRLGDIPRIGNGTPETFSAEAAIAARPDLVVLGRAFAGRLDGDGTSPLMRQLAAAGIPVLIADFHTRPLEDTAPSLRALGAAVGRTEAAEAFLAFYRARLDRIAGRLAERSVNRPRVLMHVHAGGMDCCFSPGRGTLHDMIARAGGHNIGADLLPGASGQLSLEQVLSARADIYVATGGPHLAGRGGLVLGTGIAEAEARRTFAALLARPEIAAIPAVSGGRAFGLWHGFADTPLHVVAIEALARLLHPDLFADLDPAATLGEANRFLALPLNGTFWIAPR